MPFSHYCRASTAGAHPLAAGLLALVVLASGGCALRDIAHSDSAGTACEPEVAEVVCTAQGRLKGVVENGTLAFKGVPYARPPVGPLRWRPAVAAAAWPGVRDASRFGSVCPQLAGTEVIGDEDCLTLNVWKPLSPQADRLPVMVFFAGGGNHAFSGQGAPVFGGVSYNGERLVPEGVLFVSFNYRLGALGFLAHPALDAERPEKVSGNYGSLDQIAMLRWLQANIGAFGGDPGRILVFGTSAGGGNICSLVAAPGARDLFQGVAMQASVPTGCELPTLADAQDGTGRLVVQQLGCDGRDTAVCLRKKPFSEVVQAAPGTFSVLPRLYGPNVDGVVFPEQPRATITRRAHTPVPVIIGNSHEETMLFVNALGPLTNAIQYREAIAKVFGEGHSARIVAVYPAASYPSPRQAMVRLTTDALFTCQSRRVARLLSQSQSEPVYRYLFNHVLENDPALKALGAVHTIEHPFFFSWEGKYRPTEADRAVQRLMVGHWTALARWGDPSAGAAAAWPPHQPGDTFLLIGPAPAISRGDGEAQCDFWDTVALPQPHL